MSYAEAFAALEARSKNLPGWVTQMRRLAFERFDRLGFPTTSDEEWKYSDVSPIRAIPIESAPVEYDVPRVDGVFSGTIAELLRNPSPHAARLEEHLSRHAHYDNDAFTALNTALFENGIFLYVPPGAVIQDVIEIAHVVRGGRTSYPRTLIVIGDGAKATIIENYSNAAKEESFSNVVTEIVAGRDANVDHYKIQTDEPRTWHIGRTQISLDRAARFRTHTITMGTRFARNTTGATLNDEGIECTLNGLYVVTADQHVDNHTAIDHAKPHCASHELYKGILDGKSRAVFNGKVFVRKDAQKTDAKQTNRNLLLSDDATVDTKPQLEIFADDVKCTHGATIGQLDDDALFYLRSRGVGEEAARSLLTYGFAADILERIAVDSLRERLDAILHERLATRLA